MSNQKGFSLVELLVSVAILSMVILTGSYAYRTYSVFWQKEVGYFTTEFVTTKNMVAFFGILKNIKPYLLKNDSGEPFYYFEGGRSVIRSVTAASVSNIQYPAYFELKINEESNSLSVTYSEKIIKDRLIQNETDITDYDMVYQLVKDMDDISFEYYGWPHYDEWIKSRQTDEKTGQQWFGYYSGKDTWVTPTSIRVKLSKSGKLSEIDVPLNTWPEGQLEFYLQGNE